MKATSPSTAERPVQSGEGEPVLSTRKRGNGLYHRILFAADFAPDSTPVFKHALQLAKQNNAELLVLHACDLPKSAGFMPAECYDEWLINYRVRTSDQAKTFVNQARQEGVRSHAVICDGLPEDVIARAVGKTKIDLVVIGTHRRLGLSRFLSPSIAARIIPRANCSVLTIRRGDGSYP